MLSATCDKTEWIRLKWVHGRSGKSEGGEKVGRGVEYRTHHIPKVAIYLKQMSPYERTQYKPAVCHVTGSI